MKISERVDRLRLSMEEKGIDAYVIPTADYHQSEYVGEHFKVRAFMTGFTGSAGTAVFTKNEAGMWTDGRYFIQAALQMKDTGVALRKMGEPGVPTVEEYLKETLPEGGVIGFDGRTVGIDEGLSYAAIAEAKHGSIVYDCDLVDSIWTNRPPLSEKPAFLLDLKYAGETTASKLERVRSEMKKAGANLHVITSLDDIGWLLNVRGDDVEYFPLLLSYAIVKMDSVELYADERKFNDEIKAEFIKNHVHIHPYNDIYEAVKTFGGDDTVLVDPRRLNYALYNNMPEAVKTVKQENPTIIMKAVKNDVEIENIRKAEIKDSIAHTKFMYWLKQNVGKMKITELSASDKLDEFRAEQGNFLWPSFEPICAYKEHGAIVHYTSSPETDVELKEGGMFLTDTGANFYEGSTDITRTYVFGEISQIEKEHFTAVAISNLNLADVKFLYGCSGMNLDYVAREPFWRQNLNFNHGTGHGVGYLGNIHEPPTGFRWQFRPNEIHPFEANMIITDEPGIYIEGSHGIRTENELLVCNGEKNEYGQFMHFEPITFVPIDLDAIIPELMTEKERTLLNDYHKKVYELIAPHLTKDEQEWLKEYTRAI
ncbi:aminopeptidase P family N-terminal domain-containing protein [Clostridium sp. C105KSO13]|uniref:aminopeptidase P family N-terminal domain-containing protein n=1 Tax=Clostridium sp. C105KSO13 TaxID=1776045 RepID=UPI000740881F|nr:aminopeptidase P family N-terminal domain-containing protein [Clostridium sp. C105KSO13]CUX43703.1 putative peptidase [Clostridium sp. C105KSO13]